MGDCLKARARRGAAGEAARWAASRYHRWACLTPEDHPEMDSIFAAVITTRYDIEARARPGCRAASIRTALGILRDAGTIRSLCHLAVLMLAAEGGFTGGRTPANEVYVEVIGAELTTAGVPGEYAFGEDLHLCPKRRCAVYLPSIRMLRLLL